jgi:hypothetical protein
MTKLDNRDPNEFIINSYYDYAEWIKFIQRNKLGMKLHLLSAGWRHRNLKVELSPAMLELVETNCLHADGNTPCSICSQAYRDHPTIVGAEYLHILCNGRGVKL